ncbi:MAG: beta-Ala-His dipeptidase [Clostridia bacterium]|nr:beta-Ala-His dipeptidase [Clostridia bacterium]
MRRFIAVTLILCLCLTLITGCNRNEEVVTDDSVIQAAILEEFNKISIIPRESGHERAISSYLKTWAKDNGFEVLRDASNNIIINKPATAGYENAPTTILQCNMDMLTATAEGVVFDPVNTPIKTINNGDTLSAEGTNLGADSGIGMATILYVLKNASNHGPIRGIFTSDGEIGMTGAENLKEKHLEGDYLINVGWNANRTICLGSGGTASYEMMHPIEWTVPQNAVPYVLSITGLNGGTAEKDINNGGANAIKTIGDILATAQGQGILFELAAFNGGISGDTIPTAATAVIIINESDQKKMQNVVDDAMAAFKDAYGGSEKDYTITYQETQMPDKVVSFEDNGSIISFIYGIINGVQSISESYSDVVESASNLGMVSTATGNFTCKVSAASTSDVGLYEMTTAHEAISSMCGLEYTYFEGTPRWPAHEDSVLYTSVSEIYNDLYDKKIKSRIVHNDLEMGWFAKKNPRLQIISIGASIKNSNTPEETVDLDSVTRPSDVIIKFLELQKDKSISTTTNNKKPG